MPSRPERARIHADLDEIAPNTFIIHNDKVRPVLRGEGVTVGHTFELVSPRRQGLLGRLKARGFNVRTLESRLERLPRLPAAPTLGPLISREIGGKERWSVFDGNDLRWREIRPAEQNGKSVISLQAGSLVRRRRSRTGGDFFQVERAKTGGVNLLPLSDSEAVLRGYAQATADSDIEIEVREREGGYLLPLDFVLPQSYLEMLRCTGAQTAEGLLIGQAGWPFALMTLHRLNLRPSLGDAEVELSPTFYDPQPAGDEDWEEEDGDGDGGWDGR
ncbi:MAG TPA: hypothetical protein VD886_03160 [Herpetosiphonaceae bacterium]|nr:hypothetical protein [Herpetosiphonaceae bacterium]